MVIDVDDEPYRAYDRALGDTTYGLGHLGLGSVDVNFKCSSAEETFDPAYYNGDSAVSSESVLKEPMVDRIKGFREVKIDQVDSTPFVDPFCNQFFCHEEVGQCRTSGKETMLSRRQ